MKVLLFGRDGQLGSELSRLLAAKVDLRAHARDSVDLTHPEQATGAIRDFQPGVVINAAAYTAVDKAESEPELAHAINAAAVGAIANTCKDIGALLIHYSTDYVFDGAKGAPYLEHDAPHPLNVYGRTKLAGEQAVLRSGCRHLILRIGWVYSATGKNFFNTVLRLARQGGPLRIVDDQIGVPTSTAAVARLTAAMLSAPHPPEGLFHFTPSGQTSWHGFAQAVVREMGLDVHVQPISTSDYPTAARRPPYSVLSAERLQHAFPFVQSTWQELLREVVAAVRGKE